jgi:hypothetical protein
MMKKIKREDFDCIKEDNSEEEDKKQWERSKIIFDHFFEYLKDKGLKESTASKRTQRIVFFILDYLFVYGDVLSILEVSGDTIRTFLGNWYIRKVLNSGKTEMKEFLRAISDFFTFIRNEGFITDLDLEEIKEVCKDVGWFEMRLQSYSAAEGDEFYEWIEEYNYDW